MSNVLTIDIGGSSIKYGVFNSKNQLVEKGSKPVPPTFDLLVELVCDIYNQGEYQGIGISSPGGVDSKTGEGFGISAIDYIPSKNLKQEIEAKLGIRVEIANDANCAGLSEVHFTDGLENIGYIVLGSGVGGCVIIDGKVVDGAGFYGGEFGYIPYRGKTFSFWAGMIGLSERATGQAKTVMPGIEIFKLAEAGDIQAKQAIDDYFTAIADLCAILKYTIDPQKIIFAGAITNRPTFLEELRRKCDVIAPTEPDTNLDGMEMTISEFGSDANLYGAYANYVRRG